MCLVSKALHYSVYSHAMILLLVAFRYMTALYSLASILTLFVTRNTLGLLRLIILLLYHIMSIVDGIVGSDVH